MIFTKLTRSLLGVLRPYTKVSKNVFLLRNKRFPSLHLGHSFFNLSRMESDGEILSSFTRLVNEHHIVIFSKTTCPYCTKVKEIFASLNKEVYCFELNTYPEQKCSQMQDVLQNMSGQRTVPNVFIHGKHVGGCSDTQQALADFSLYDMLENKFNSYNFDLVVIGGGSGGLAASKQAAAYNRKVAVCDLVTPSPQGTTWGLGGTCVNVGCIPKKLMHKASIIGEDIDDCTAFGWSTDMKAHSWSDMVDNVQNYIKSLNWKYRKSLRDKNVEYFNNFAKFKDNHTLVLTNKKGEFQKEITSQNFLIAVGGRPTYPEFPGALEHCLTSDDIFSLSEPPGKTLVVGASYIALETAGFLRGLNMDVTVMVRSILLRGFDQEIAEMIGQNMELHGIRFLKNYIPTSVTRLNERELLVVSEAADGSKLEETYQTVFLAVGRRPCTENIGLQELGVVLEADGRVQVNEAHQSSVRNIFAVGDVIEKKLQLTPVAIQQGKLLAQRLYGKKNELFDYEAVPTTVFTPLEYGCVGLSEEAAYEKYGREDIEVYHIHFQPLEWELPSRNRNQSFAKLVCRKSEQERIVGLHYLGPNAGEVTQGFALGIKKKATKDDFDNLIGIHPTCAEVFTTMTVTKASGKSADAEGC